MFFFGAGGSKANKNWKTGGQFSGKTRRSPPPPETGETNLGHQVTKKRPGKWLPPLCVTTGSCRILWKICFVRKNIYIKEVQSDCFWLSWVAVLLQFVLSTCFFSSAHLQKHVEPQRDIKKAWIRQSFLVDFNFHRQSKCCNPNSFELFRSSRTFHPLRCWTWTGPPEPPTPVEEAELSLQAKQVGFFFVGWDFVSPKLDITVHWSSSQYYTLNLMFSRVWF